MEAQELRRDHNSDRPGELIHPHDRCGPPWARHMQMTDCPGDGT